MNKKLLLVDLLPVLLAAMSQFHSEDYEFHTETDLTTKLLVITGKVDLRHLDLSFPLQEDVHQEKLVILHSLGLFRDTLNFGSAIGNTNFDVFQQVDNAFVSWYDGHTFLIILELPVEKRQPQGNQSI